MRRSAHLLVAATAALLLSACAGGTSETATAAGTSPADGAAVAESTVVVHRTATCECCGEYEAYLEASGFTVETMIHEDLAQVKDDLGVPDDQLSCHTNEVAGYAAEGHVPAEALHQLLAEAPEVDGVSLAGMPAGAPGMPGEKEGPLVVRTFADGEVSGELSSF